MPFLSSANLIRTAAKSPQDMPAHQIQLNKKRMEDIDVISEMQRLKVEVPTNQPVAKTVEQLLKELDGLQSELLDASPSTTNNPATPEHLLNDRMAIQSKSQLFDNFFDSMSNLPAENFRDSITTVCTEQGRIISYPPAPRPPRIPMPPMPTQSSITVEKLLSRPCLSGWLHRQSSSSPSDNNPPIFIRSFVILYNATLHFFVSDEPTGSIFDLFSLHCDSIVKICDGHVLEVTTSSTLSIRLKCHDSNELAIWFDALQQAVLSLNLERSSSGKRRHIPSPLRTTNRPPPVVVPMDYTFPTTEMSPTSPSAWSAIYEKGMSSPRRLSPVVTSPHSGGQPLSAKAPSSAASQSTIPSVLLNTTSSRKKAQSCDIYDFVNQVCSFFLSKSNLTFR